MEFVKDIFTEKRWYKILVSCAIALPFILIVFVMLSYPQTQSSESSKCGSSPIPFLLWKKVSRSAR